MKAFHDKIFPSMYRLRSFAISAVAIALFLTVVAAPTFSRAAGPRAQTSFRVCIDPGHPSENNDGRELLNGLREVDVNWAVAQALRSLLEEKGYAVLLTKSSLQESVTNKRRAEIANEASADLMLRLHADSEGPSGYTIYFPRREGTVRGVTGPLPAMIEASDRAATAFHRGLKAELGDKLKDNGIRGDEQTFIGGKQGALTGSIHSKVPTILVEMVNLAKPTDANWIKEPANQKIFAQGLLAGVAAVAKSSAR